MILPRLGDLNAAEEHLHLALDIHGLDRRRTRAIALADLVWLRRGDVDGTMLREDGVLEVKPRRGCWRVDIEAYHPKDLDTLQAIFAAPCLTTF
ncbi:hypothetical protein [Streptomyces decoyicus]|uniref:hypothetical protein n=1 Tax=Streptomyces decoyicus TaxID=249567 RepID=UPI00364EDE38